MSEKERFDMDNLFFDASGERLEENQAAALFAHALARAAYTVDLAAFQAAGFEDFSCRINSDIMTGNPFNFDGGLRDGLTAAVQALLARARMHFAGPIAQIKGTTRPKESDYAKAIFMAMDRGPYTLVAIGFTGTCKRVDDWVNNFSFQQEEGCHRGFLRLAREIEEAEDKIRFDRTGARQGIKGLTLREILDACAAGDRHYRFVFAGHSQGAAVMQLYTRLLISRGIDPGCIWGMGFASPSVVFEPDPGAASGCLVHYLSSDDLIARVGAKYHIGACRVLGLNEKDREAIYGGNWQKKAFRDAMGTLCRLKNSREAMLFMVALMENVGDTGNWSMLSALENMNFLFNLWGKALTGRVDQQVKRMRDAALKACMDAFDGTQLPLHELKWYRRCQKALFLKYGTTEGVRALTEAMIEAHRLPSGKEDARAAYHYLVTEGYDRLIEMHDEPISPMQLPPMAISRARHVVRRRFGRAGRFAGRARR